MPGDPPFHPPGPFPGPGGFPAQLQHVPVNHHIPVGDPRFDSLFKVPTIVNAGSPLLSPSSKFNICLLHYFIISFFIFHIPVSLLDTPYFIIPFFIFHTPVSLLHTPYFIPHSMSYSSVITSCSILHNSMSYQ